MLQKNNLTEEEFRSLAATVFNNVINAFEDIDPDVAECEEQLGSVIITLAEQSRWVLSLQPPVRQIWLAMASLGKAYHFHLVDNNWKDTKDNSRELLSHLEDILAKNNITVNIKRQ